MEKSSDESEEAVPQDPNPAPHILNLGDETAYYVYHPPRYSLPPYQDPKLEDLDLREQIKVICSYQNVLYKNIAKQAKNQLASFDLPNPTDPLKSMIVQMLNDDTYDKSIGSSGSTDPSQLYLSSKGRLTKRKYYAESDIDPKDGASISQESGDDESPSRKKAALSPSRSRTSRQKLNSDISENTGSPKKSNVKTHSPITRQQKKGTDGFAEPAVPPTTRKNTKNLVECPICQQHFPEKEVEKHASTCGLIPVEVGNMSSNESELLCDHCQEVILTTEEYELHRTICSRGGPSHL